MIHALIERTREGRMHVIRTLKAPPATRRSVLIATLVTALIGAFALGVQAADQRLDLADANLEKAYALLLASQTSTENEKAAREFYRHIERALTLIERARERIVAAKAAVDNP
jgi:hypothetical protein